MNIFSPPFQKLLDPPADILSECGLLDNKVEAGMG
jgi:hypothetical protein